MVLSAFIDNIPYVAAMLPVVQGVAALMNDGVGMEPELFYFGLLTGATLGGNLTPIGASANIAAIGILRKNGETVHHPRLPAHRRALYAGGSPCWQAMRTSGCSGAKSDLLKKMKKKQKTPTLCTARKDHRPAEGFFRGTQDDICSERKKLF